MADLPTTFLDHVDAEMLGHVDQYAAGDQRGYLADIQLGQTRGLGEFNTPIAVVKLPRLAQMAQAIQLRASAQPHLHQVVIRRSCPTQGGR